MIVFLLWREYRLSIAELHSLYKDCKLIYHNQKIAVFDSLSEARVKEDFHKIGWSIKAIKIINKLPQLKHFINDSIGFIDKLGFDDSKKVIYAIASYTSQNIDIFTLWIQLKKEMKKRLFLNPRFINKGNLNINAAWYKKEWLESNWFELNIIEIWEEVYLWNTISYQDIDSYSSRDTWKVRDMQVWMLPPKLAQIMINLSWTINEWIYDPFCWLWTVLIEALIQGKNEVYWSDISDEMVDATYRNIQEYINDSIESEVFRLDARNINKVDFLKWNKWISIVTEWYLWSIMTKWHVNEDKILEQRKSLAQIYEPFFKWLKDLNFKWNIVISFPFWELRWKYQYFEEIYQILKRYWFEPLMILPENSEYRATKTWSLLYHRPWQQVWREIFLLKQKNR